ncbi:hypothetical protein JOC34_000635 [Virgibacillus halotolerans]|uniref:hypothetical protein n=1 Tax=Virgibacillus halotolerans TaxID=1071053 RepID=UPI00195FCEFA|nr:hypothetical protein [Virgibacillus halotolerans]MBM7598278.1 hypothetical protein [Virgibacillus halotolerans]
MPKYRKKPVVIEAIQYLHNDNRKEYESFVDDGSLIYDEDTLDRAYIRTLEGDMKLSYGDYIIKGVKGEFYPCKPDIFESTYEGEYSQLNVNENGKN